MCINLHFEAGATTPADDGSCTPATIVAANMLALELAATAREELALASLAAEILGGLGSGTDYPKDRGKWIDGIVAAISDASHHRWTLHELAEVADRHPVHVAQAFRAKTGISLGAFQRLRRLTSLSLALRRGNRPLAMLAAEFGYCDQSHMNAEFRAAFGVSPGRYRRDFH